MNNVHYFDVRGGLSKLGKEAYWWELDDLLDKFEMGKVKLFAENQTQAHAAQMPGQTELYGAPRGSCLLSTRRTGRATQ